MALRLKSKSLLPPNIKFNLSRFKEPFCSKEKKKFRRYETVKFKTAFFRQKSEKFNKCGKILFISGPARNGNHIVMSMLDGHPQIQCQPGEDFLLREFISKAKENEKELVNKIRKLKNVNFITKMSGAYTNKWKTLYSAWKKKKKFKVWSGQQPINKSHVSDFQNYTPKINYYSYENHLKKNLKVIRKAKTFLDFLKIYFESLSKLVTKRKNLTYKHLYVYSGLRRELFYLLDKTDNIICVCPIRKFDSFYFSYAKSRFKTNQVKQKPLNELWEHWRHKTIDYLLLQKKYPKKIIFVKFEDLINKSDTTAKKLCKRLGIKFSKKLKRATILDKAVKGNSSFAKTDDYKGKFYKDSINKQFPLKILPKEYFQILKLVHNKCI